MSESTPKQTRRGILAGISASVAAPAVASDGEAPATEAASVLPDARVRTHWMVLANPVRNEFELFFVAGPDGGKDGNVMAQIRVNPEQAERIARQILADLEGWSEQVAKAQQAYGVTA